MATASMTSKNLASTSGALTSQDKLKLWLAGLLFVAGMAAYYFLGNYGTLAQVSALFAGVGLGGIIFSGTAPGLALTGFIKEARTEVRKVVWPTRTETLQTTLIISVVVIIVGIMLWLMDTAIAWAIEKLTVGS